MSKRRARQAVSEDESAEEPAPTPTQKSRSNRRRAEEEPTPSQSSARGKRRAVAENESPASQPSSRARQATNEPARVEEDGRTSAASRKALENLSSTEQEKLLGDLMRVVLFQHSKGLATTRDLLNEKVMKDYKERRGLLKVLIQMAQDRFKTVMGLEMVEAPKISEDDDDPPATQTAARDTGNAKYLLRNAFTEEAHLRQINADGNVATRGLLLAILAIIEICEGRVRQTLLLQQLELLGIVSTSRRPHPVFGDVNKLIQSVLPQQLYLSRKKISDGKQGFDYEYRAGPRAKVEVDAKLLGEMVAEIYNREAGPRGRAAPQM